MSLKSKRSRLSKPVYDTAKHIMIRGGMLVLVLGIISAIAVFSGALAARTPDQTRGVGSSSNTSQRVTKGQAGVVKGSHAITPHINAGNPLLPTFTREDVIAWVSANPVGRMPALEPPTIVKVEFTTDSDVKNVLGESAGLPDTALVCYVEIHGRFAAPGPPGATPRVFTRVWEVFDGRTGNFLMAVGSVK